MKRCIVLMIILLEVVVSLSVVRADDWFVEITNETLKSVTVIAHYKDEDIDPEAFEVAGFGNKEKLFFKKGKVEWVSIGSQDEGPGTCIKYGLACNNVVIDYEKEGSFLRRHLLFGK